MIATAAKLHPVYRRTGVHGTDVQVKVTLERSESLRVLNVGGEHVKCAVKDRGVEPEHLALELLSPPERCAR